MGLIKEIGLAVRQELREYLLRELEAIRQESEAAAVPKAGERPASKVEEVVRPAAEPKVEEKPQAAENNDKDKREEVREEPKREIVKLNHEKIEKILYSERPDYILIPVDGFAELRQLPADEFALYVKFLALAQEQKKNYGYLGNNIRKRIGAEDMSPEKFREITDNLVAYGFMSTENITELQRTFTLYVPFNEEYMVRADAPQKSARPEPDPEPEVKRQPQQQPAPKPEAAKPQPAPKPQPAQPVKPAPKKDQKPEAESAKPARKPAKQAKNTDNRQKPEIPGKAVDGMENDDMYKSYKTFVSLEIDKAKMRVGRSNFDKIYMEAVKYIDKKYGFRVLSDQEKFQEYLTNYYISAFDIPTFEEWKKTKA